MSQSQSEILTDAHFAEDKSHFQALPKQEMAPGLHLHPAHDPITYPQLKRLLPAASPARANGVSPSSQVSS